MFWRILNPRISNQKNFWKNLLVHWLARFQKKLSWNIWLEQNIKNPVDMFENQKFRKNFRICLGVSNSYWKIRTQKSWKKCVEPPSDGKAPKGRRKSKNSFKFCRYPSTRLRNDWKVIEGDFPSKSATLMLTLKICHANYFLISIFPIQIPLLHLKRVIFQNLPVRKGQSFMVEAVDAVYALVRFSSHPNFNL